MEIIHKIEDSTEIKLSGFVARREVQILKEKST